MPDDTAQAAETAIMPRAKLPVVTTISLGADRLTVRIYHDGSVDIEHSAGHTSVALYLPRTQAGDLINALAPDRAALIETLDLLALAAEAHCPSALIDDPEVVADARDLRHAIDAARDVLGAHAS